MNIGKCLKCEKIFIGFLVFKRRKQQPNSKVKKGGVFLVRFDALTDLSCAFLTSSSCPFYGRGWRI